MCMVSIHIESKMENNVYKLGKIDDRIPVLQLTSSIKEQKR